MVNLEAVVDDVIQRWTKKYKNALVNGDALQYNWNLIGQEFNRKITYQDNRLVVVPAQTGTGKTLFTKTYLAHLLAYTDEPALMVVREQVTAQETANDINAWSKRLVSNHRSTAVASYSGDIEIEGQTYTGKKIWEKESQNAQILIVTHAQLTMAAEEKWREVGNAVSRLDKIYSSISGDRKLVIIDEEISLVSGYSLNVRGLRYIENQFNSLMNSDYEEKYPKLQTDSFFKQQLTNLKRLKQHLQTFEKSDKSKKHWIHLQEQFKGKNPTDTKRLAEYIKDVYWDRIAFDTNYISHRRRHAERMEQVLASADVFTRTWSYWEDSDKSAKMTNLMVTTGLCSGAVILDATSTINSTYDLLKEESGLVDCDITPVRKIKDYSNGSIHICYTNYSGKGMGETFSNDGVPTEGDLSNRTTSIFNELEKLVVSGEAATSRMLVVVHKDYVKSALKKIKNNDLDEKFEKISVTHWGVIDGKNDFRDYNSIFISSVPFLPNEKLTETLMTLIGPKAINYTEQGVVELKRQLWITSAVSRMVQAINRIGFRKVIDGEGNVAPCKAYVVLPKFKGGEEAKELLLSALDGIQVEDWDFAYKSTRVNKKRSKKTIFEKLLEYASTPELVGCWSLKEFSTNAGVSYGGKPAKDCRTALLDSKSDFYKQLTEYGWTITSVKKSRYTYLTISR